MNEAYKIEIPLKKNILFICLFATVLFVGIAIYFINNAKLFNLGSTIQAIAIGVAISFGILGLMCIGKLIDFTPALTITTDGILNNSDLTVNDEIIIKWEDISEIKVTEGVKRIAIMLNNPKDYIERQSSPRIKRAMTISYSTYGTPVSISTLFLKCSSSELIELLIEKLHTHKTNLVTKSQSGNS